MLVRELLFELGFDAKNAERNAKKMDKIVVGLKRNLVRLGAAAVTAAVAVGATGAKIVDEYTALESRIKLVTDGMYELKTAQEGIYQAAQNTGTAYAAASDLYIRLARSTRRYGYEQEQILAVTETIQKAMVVSGDAGSAGAQAALFQLGQGLQSGTLRGEELNSVLEQAPRLAEAIAAGMGIDPGELRKNAEAGKITAQRVMESLLNQAQAVDKEFMQMDTRQSQSKTRLANAYKKLVYEISKEEDVQASLVNFWDELRKIVESEDFKKSLKFLIQVFILLGKAFGFVITVISKLMGIFANLIDAAGGLDRVIRILSSALIAFGAVAIARAVIGLISFITTLGWGFTATWLLNGAMAALSALMGLITWPVLLAVAAFTALFFIVEDLWAFFTGGDSVTGRFLDKLTGWAKDFMNWLQPVVDLWDSFMAKIAAFGGSKYNPKNWFGDDEQEQRAAAAISGGNVNQRNVQQNNIQVTVPAGTNKEQAEYISRQVENAVDSANQRQLREARNNFPEVE